MENQEDTVVLEIEGSPVKCGKQILIEHSDYFSAMFTGGFKESSQTEIKIEGVDLKSFNTILLLLWDQSYLIDINEVHLVLQAACMLQFNAIKKVCEDRIIDSLNPSICVKIWKTTELLDIFPLWVKAKSMALEEFTEIFDNNSVLELTLDEICMYLGHINLRVHNEMSVFQAAMNWWYENQEVYEDMDSTKILLRLLNCVDFKKLKDNEIKEMKTYPDIADNSEIISILNCILYLLGNESEVQCEFSTEQIKYAIHMSNSESRQVPEIPCILLQADLTGKDSTKKKLKDSEKNQEDVVIYDKFHRKRFMLDVSRCRVHDQLFLNDNTSAVIYDTATKKFRDFFLIDKYKIKDLAGFKLLAYKEFVLFFGGEYIIGGGRWNYNVWSYDTIKEKWERKCMLPEGRRHFETVIIDNCIYIVGGVGRYRVTQENLLWYDFKSDEWSPLVPLPYNNTHSFKCCSFNGQLFIVYLSEKRAFMFNASLKTWRSIIITIEKGTADNMGDFTLFSDNEYFFAKGKYLIQFKLDNDTLVPLKRIVMADIDYEEIDSVLCNNKMYTLYKCLDGRYNFYYIFEALNLKTDALHYIFENIVQELDTIEVDDKLFSPTQYTKLFSINCYCVVRENILINSFIH